VDLVAPHSGKGCGKIVGTSSERDARGCFAQEFYAKTAVKAGRAYRYSLRYRTEAAFPGAGLVLIDSYTKEGEGP
jgi:hypothetical protein